MRILHEVYGDSRPIGQLEAGFFAITQVPGQTVREYSVMLHRRFRALQDRQKQAREPVFTDRHLRDQFVAGLQLHLRRKAEDLCYDHHDVSFLDVRERVLRWDGTQGEVQSNIVQHSAETAGVLQLVRDLATQVETLAKTVGELKSKKPPQARRPAGQRPPLEWAEDGRPICRFCKEVGHIGSACPKAQEN